MRWPSTWDTSTWLMAGGAVFGSVFVGGYALGFATRAAAAVGRFAVGCGLGLLLLGAGAYAWLRLRGP